MGILSVRTPRLKAVAFDFDGTLVDSNQIKRSAYFTVTKEIEGATGFLEKLLDSESDLDRYGVFKRVSHEYFSPTKAARIAIVLADRYSKLCEHLINQAEEIAGATMLLEALHRESIRLFVCSATPHTHLMPIVQYRPWFSLLSGVFGVPPTKQERLINLMEQWNLKSNEIVMIGDSESDHIAAEAVGCEFIAVGDWLGTRNMLANNPFPDLHAIRNFWSI